MKNLNGPIRSLKQKDHEPNSGGFNQDILAPSKLLWLALADCIIVMILCAATRSILMSVTFAMFALYFLYLGIPFGSLTTTLSKACEDLATDYEAGSYDSAIGLLARYQELKKSSQLAM